jgi:hypothetical protein
LRHAGRILGVSLLVNGGLFATGISSCMFDTSLPSQNADPCYQAGSFFANPLALAPVTLDWGQVGSANLPNQLGGTVNTTIAGVAVSVTSGPDFTPNNPGASPAFRRVNNEVYVWDPNLNGVGAWVIPENSVDPAIHTDNTYDGHFNAPGPSPQPGDGTHLLDMNGTGSYVITFNQGINAVGLLMSVQGSGFNTDFDATISAFGQSGSLLATYLIDTTGVGGQCDSINSNPPTPCNDAPFLGVKAPGNLSNQQIYQIVISATTGVGNLSSVLLGPLQFDLVPSPEPSVVFLCGAGLVLIGVLRRKQAIAGRSQRSR